MSKYIRTLQPVEIFRDHTSDSKILKTLDADQLIRYNREKRRNGINWMEVYVDSVTKGYLKKDKSKIFLCKHAVLEDEEAVGINYTSKNGQPLSFFDAFTTGPGALSAPTTIEINRLKDKEKGDIEYLKLGYDPNIVDVKFFRLKKKYKFYVTYKDESDKKLIQINTLDGAHGYILPKTDYTETKDLWMKYLLYVIVIISGLITFGVALALGWLVIGLILFIPGAIIGAILVFVLKLIFMGLGEVFHQIRKRL